MTRKFLLDSYFATDSNTTYLLKLKANKVPVGFKPLLLTLISDPGKCKKGGGDLNQTDKVHGLVKMPLKLYTDSYNQKLY